MAQDRNVAQAVENDGIAIGVVAENEVAGGVSRRALCVRIRAKIIKGFRMTRKMIIKGYGIVRK